MVATWSLSVEGGPDHTRIPRTAQDTFARPLQYPVVKSIADWSRFDPGRRNYVIDANTSEEHSAHQIDGHDGRAGRLGRRRHAGGWAAARGADTARGRGAASAGAAAGPAGGVSAAGAGRSGTNRARQDALQRHLQLLPRL